MSPDAHRPSAGTGLTLALLVSACAHLTLWVALPRWQAPEHQPAPPTSTSIDAEIVEVSPPPSARPMRLPVRVSASSAPLRAKRRGRSSPLPPTMALGPSSPSGWSAEASPMALGEIPLAASGDGDAVVSAGLPVRPGSGGPAAGGQGADPGSGGDDERVLSQLQDRLARAAVRCYPQAAERLGLAGTSTIHFCVSGAGDATDIRLVQSSGMGLLDDAAAECVVRQASPLPLTQRCWSVPIRFSPHPS